MQKTIQKMERILVACETYLMVGAMTVFAFCVVVDVICRKLFGVSLDSMQELGKYLMVWATFIGASLGVKYREHSSMTLVIDSVPKGLRIAMSVLVNLISAGATGFAGYFAFKQFLLVKKMGSMTVTLWGLPVWALYCIVPLSFFVMAARFLVRAYRQPGEIMEASKGGREI